MSENVGNVSTPFEWKTFLGEMANYGKLINDKLPSSFHSSTIVDIEDAWKEQ